MNASNAGEQFYTFSCLCAWLVKSKCRLPIEGPLNPQDYEDPHLTIHTILEALRLVHKDGREEGVLSVEFPPAKLKQGHGSEVIHVLTVLANAALERSHNTGGQATIVIKGHSDAGRDEDEVSAEPTDQDNELEINFEQQYTLMEEEEAAPLEVTVPTERQILQSTTDEQQWRLEVERVLPRLKVALRPGDHKADWRTHEAEMQAHKKMFDAHFNDTRVAIEKLARDVTTSLDKIGSREKYLQLQLEPLINECRALKEQLTAVQDNYRVVSGGVTSKSQTLSKLSDDLDAIKSEMEERGSSMTDGTPLIALRKTLAKLKQELITVDIRIGVATHTILQANLNESTAQQLKQRGALDSPVKLTRSSLQRLVF